MTWFEFRILTNIFLLFAVHWHFSFLCICFLSIFHFPITTTQKIDEKLQDNRFLLWLQKKSMIRMSEKVEKEVFCVWKSHHLLPVPVLDFLLLFFFLLFGEYFVSNVSTVSEKMFVENVINWKPQHKKTDEKIKWILVVMAPFFRLGSFHHKTKINGRKNIKSF